VKPTNIICLAIDRLSAAYLGAYGNTWISTPVIDALAADSLLLDRATIDSPRLEVLYRSLWLGIHALCPDARSHNRGSLPAALASAGWNTTLLTDEPIVAEHGLAADFGERTLIKPSAANANHEVASSIDETDAADFFVAAGQALASLKPPYFLWLHTGTLGRIWDAPIELREHYTDEDDPAPGNWANVPNKILPEKYDPDELLSISHAFAAQVTLVDQLLGSFLAELDQSDQGRDTMLVLTSTRGFPLGQHRRIGPCDDALYAELTQIPLMLRFPESFNSRHRSQAIVQPADLCATILDGAGVSSQSTVPGEGRSFLRIARGEEVLEFDRACIVAPPDQEALITPAWSLRRLKAANSEELGDSQKRTELFVKPDDWFEVNDVSDRCAEIAESMSAAIDEFTAACQTGEPATLAKLPEELVIGID
jgi:hypothetical protein